MADQEQDNKSSGMYDPLTGCLPIVVMLVVSATIFTGFVLR